jgi:GntR family transcriptional regulator / MocR family aminotransferase
MRRDARPDGNRSVLTPPIELRRASGTPLFRQIEAQLRRAILDGRIRPGARLPAVRTLAEEFGVARVTVTSAYDLLAAEGFVEARVGSGTRVVERLPDTGISVDRSRSTGSITRHPGRVRRMAIGDLAPIRTIDRTAADDASSAASARYDLRPGNVSLDVLPRAWEDSLRRAWRDLRVPRWRELLGYPPPNGDPELRREVAAYLGSGRGIACQADDIIITRGTQAVLHVAGLTYLGPGKTCAVEDPGYISARRAIALSGAAIVPIPVDGNGIDPGTLPRVANALMITPSWQYPLGGALSALDRQRVLEWADHTNSLVIEDDADSELRYRGRPELALKAMDDLDQVVYVGSVSKVLFPGVRVGFAIVPSATRDAFVTGLEMTGRGPSAVEQRALAIFMADGHLERHIRRLRATYADRQSRFIESLVAAVRSPIDIPPMSAGMHLILRLCDPRLTGQDLVRRAKAQGVLISSVGDSRVVPARDDRLMVAYAGLDEADVQPAAQALAEVIDAYALEQGRKQGTARPSLRLEGPGVPPRGFGTDATP